MTERSKVGLEMSGSTIHLPPVQWACEGCGIAVEMPRLASAAAAQEQAGVDRFARCGQCQHIHDLASNYVRKHPSLLTHVFNIDVVEYVENVIIGLAVLGRLPDTNLEFILPRLQSAVRGLRFRESSTAMGGSCTPHPWAHLTADQRANLRSAYATVLRDRIALGEPPIIVPCPTRGCLFCGVASVSRPALLVAQRGTLWMWQQVTTTLASLGGRDEVHVTGHVCPPCGQAIAESRAVGISSRGRAVADYLESSSPAKADHLRSMMAYEYPPSLPAWAALAPAREPNREPWGHLRPVIDRL